jgi:hypothetical protein
LQLAIVSTGLQIPAEGGGKTEKMQKTRAKSAISVESSRAEQGNSREIAGK